MSKSAALRREPITTCPLCGDGPFVVVAAHVARKHGMDRIEFRDWLGVDHKVSICDAAHSEYCQERMLQLSDEEVHYMRSRRIESYRRQTADRDAAAIALILSGSSLTDACARVGVTLGTGRRIIQNRAVDVGDLRAVAGERRRGQRPEWLDRATTTSTSLATARARERLRPIADLIGAGEPVGTIAQQMGVRTGQLAQRLRRHGFDLPDLRSSRPPEMVEIACSWCGKDFEIRASALRARAKQKKLQGTCCSYSCAARYRHASEPAGDVPCGTEAAYQRHVAAGVPVDDECRAAYNAAQRHRRAARKLAAERGES